MRLGDIRGRAIFEVGRYSKPNILDSLKGDKRPTQMDGFIYVARQQKIPLKRNSFLAEDWIWVVGEEDGWMNE